MDRGDCEGWNAQRGRAEGQQAPGGLRQGEGVSAGRSGGDRWAENVKVAISAASEKPCFVAAESRSSRDGNAGSKYYRKGAFQDVLGHFGRRHEMAIAAAI